MLINHSHIAHIPTADRNICVFNCRVLPKVMRACRAKGKIRIKANKSRKKTVCAGCIPECAANRPRAAIIVRQKQQKNIQITACIWGEAKKEVGFISTFSFGQIACWQGCYIYAWCLIYACYLLLPSGCSNHCVSPPPIWCRLSGLCPSRK